MEDNKHVEKNRLKGLIRFYKPYIGMFTADMIFAMIAAGVTLVIPLIVRHITSDVIYLPMEEAVDQIVRLGILMIVLTLIELGCNFYITYYGHMMGTYIERDLRNTIFSHYQKLSFNFYDNQKVGHLLSRVTADLFDITELLHHGPEDIMISVIKIVGSFIILSNVNLTLSAATIVLVVIMFVFAFFMNIKMKNAFKSNRARMGDINSQIEDSLAGIRVVKSFANEDEEISKFREGNNRFVASKRRAYRYMGTYHSVTTFLTTMITVVSLIVGAFLMTQQKMTATDLVTFILYISLFTEPIKKLINFTELFQNGYSGYTRFCEIMEINPDIVDKEDAKSLTSVDGEVRFENVSFGYQDTDERVLNNVNLHVKSGEYVALVGTSGVGKTTLCSLIPRFYDVSEGRILLDGQDIRDVKLKDLRQHIGIVQQDVYLFAGTIMENIRYGKPDATDEEIIAAAKAANAHEFIMNFENGYNTDIGQRGVKLSGGQKQRLSIARVFLKNPPILIFDEATSALDNESEKVVQESLEDLAKNRTTFVISHRLSTIRNAERIIVLSGEGVAEEGTHQVLLEKGGVYAQLYEAGH